MTGGILYLGSRDLAKLSLEPERLADAICAAFVAKAEGRVHAPSKAVFNVPGGAQFFAMSAALENGRAVNKWLAADPNPENGSARYAGLVTLSDATTGRPLALMDAGWVTAVRTAALTLAAARFLAPAGPRVLGLIGAGVQAAVHLEMLSKVFRFDRVLVTARNIDRLRSHSINKARFYLEKVSAETILLGSDIIVSAVYMEKGSDPFLDPDLLRPECFVSSVDIGKPWRIEKFSESFNIYNDDMESTRERSISERSLSNIEWRGDFSNLIKIDRISTKYLTGRNIFIFAGTALADLTIADVIYNKALVENVGTMLAA